MKLHQILHLVTRMKKVVETQLLVLLVPPVHGKHARLDINRTTCGISNHIFLRGTCHLVKHVLFL